MDDRHGRHRRAPADGRRRPADGFRTSSARRFERLVEDALSALPEELFEHVGGVRIVVEEIPPAGAGDQVPLGRYESGRTGVPDRVTLYRRPIEARSASRAELVQVIRGVLVDEIARHLGIGDDRLDELGW